MQASQSKSWFGINCRAQLARPGGKSLVHRAAGADSPGVSPRGSPLEALSKRLNAEVEQLRAENSRLQVRRDLLFIALIRATLLCPFNCCSFVKACLQGLHLPAEASAT